MKRFIKISVAVAILVFCSCSAKRQVRFVETSETSVKEVSVVEARSEERANFQFQENTQVNIKEKKEEYEISITFSEPDCGGNQHPTSIVVRGRVNERIAAVENVSETNETSEKMTVRNDSVSLNILQEREVEFAEQVKKNSATNKILNILSLTALIATFVVFWIKLR
jgi:hypothetical protein